MDGAEESAGRAASRRALRRDAVTGVEVERCCLAYATIGGGRADTRVVTTTATAAVGEAGGARRTSEATGEGSGAMSSKMSPAASPAGGRDEDGAPMGAHPPPPVGTEGVKPGGRVVRA